jgi:PAS domain S-box-containing protein
VRIVTKFWLSIGAVVAGYCATVAVDVWLALRNEERMDAATQALFPATIRCQEARHAFEAQLRLYEDGVVEGESAPIHEAAASSARVQEMLAESYALPKLGADERGKVLALAKRHLAFTASASETYLRMADPATAESVRGMARGLRDESQAIRHALNTQMTTMSSQLRQQLDDATLAMHQQRIITISAFLGIVTSTLLVIALVLTFWSRRLRSLLQASDRLAGGDYGAVLPAERDDELGRLTASFAAMRGAVQARIGELRALSISLEETVRQRTGELSGKNAALRAEISERERTERALRLLEAAINQINEAVVVTTPGDTPEHACIIHVNPAFAQVTGWREEDVRGRNLALLAGPATDRGLFAGLFAAASGGTDGAAEIICRRQDGTDYPAEWHVSPIREADGSVGNLVAIQRDITERRRSQAELEDANRQAGMAEIATGVLHNVGNVLNSVNISASQLAERLTDPRLGNLERSAKLLQEGRSIPDFLRSDPRGQQLPDYLAMLAGHIGREHAALQGEARDLVAAVDHIKAIVGMQQTYARAGGSTVLAPVRLVDICEDALRLNQSTLQRDGIAIHRVFDDLPAMLLDRHKILQILVNLVGNARQAIVEAQPPTRRLEIGLAMIDPARVRVWVADNGIGIPASHLSRIFNHGFTTKPQGHGFGLHRCANAASEMNGRLSVHSDGPGQGARFELELPIGRTQT